jgi:hypothetical protein
MGRRSSNLLVEELCMSPDCPLVGTHWHPFRLIDYIHTAKTDMVANVESVEFSVTIRVRPVSRGILKRARKK